MSAPKIALRSSRRRRLRLPLALGILSVAVLGACSQGGLVPSDAGPVATGGAASGGATGSGGVSATGGAAATGGGSSGGAASTGGAASGGASTGGASSGGAASGGASSGGAGTGGGAAAFELSVEGVLGVDNEDCTAAAPATCPLFPEDNTNLGQPVVNVSPAMQWAAGPEGTLSYAITLVDLTNTNFAHWALWDIPAETLALPAELPAGATLATPIVAKQASGIGATEEYFGSGQCGNVYEFRLYALDAATLTVANAAEPSSVLTALQALTPLDQTFVRMQSRDYCTP